METYEIIILTLLVLSVALNISLSISCDKKDIQIDHDERWKAFADRRIKELEEETLNRIEI